MKETVTIPKAQYEILLNESKKLQRVIAKIEEIQQDEDSGTDDIGAAVLDELDMWL